MKEEKTKVKKFKKQVEGITLIALVVTIIVLIILAGVAISLTIGENGIISRAQEAVKRYEEASQNEKNGLSELGKEIEDILNGGQITEEGDFAIELSYTTDNITITVSENEMGENVQYEYFINGVSKAKSTNKEEIISIELENKAPYIPTGFEHTEGEIDTGYVIKDTSIGNEFVWVPVKAGTFSVYVEATSENGTKYKSDEKELAISELTREPKYSDMRYTSWHEEDGDVNDKKSIAYFKNSVVENCGFYMGRYEMGMPGQVSGEAPTLAYDSRNVSGVPVCIANVIPWTNIDYDVAKSNLESMYNGEVQSAMMNSYARTSTLNWVYETNGKINQAGNCESFSMVNQNIFFRGYYEAFLSENYEGTIGTNGYENPFTISGQLGFLLIATGADIQGGNTFVNNNIYDLGGNAEEWSTEIFNSNSEHRKSGGGFQQFELAHFIIDSDVGFPSYGLTASYSTSSRPILYK